MCWEFEGIWEDKTLLYMLHCSYSSICLFLFLYVSNTNSNNKIFKHIRYLGGGGYQIL